MSTSEGVLDRAKTRGDVLQGYFDLIVEQALVPVHVVDADYRITRVNRRWLDKLGYDSSEVVGRPPTDFLSGESRARALDDVLPLFRSVGAARSVGLNFKSRDGRVVPVLLDAQVCSTDDVHCRSLREYRPAIGVLLRDAVEQPQLRLAIDIADGFILKATPVAELVQGIRDVHLGRPAVDRRLWPALFGDDLLR